MSAWTIDFDELAAAICARWAELFPSGQFEDRVATLNGAEQLRVGLRMAARRQDLHVVTRVTPLKGEWVVSARCSERWEDPWRT